MIPSAEMTAKVALWRQKAREGTLTKEEMKEAIAALRGERAKVAQPTAGSKVTRAKKEAAKKPDGDDLLSQLEGL